MPGSTDPASVRTLQGHQDPRTEIWTALAAAVTQPGNGWRTPALASCDADGLPRVRSLVLRDVDAASWRLSSYTDRRSPKVAQLLAQPRVELLFWCPQRRWQLRVEARASIETQGSRVEQIWDSLANTQQAGDYLTLNAPGDPVDADERWRQTSTPQLAIIDFSVQRFDWLCLSRQGHSRLAIDRDQILWLTP